MGAVHPVTCTSHDGTTRNLLMCAAEFTRDGKHKILFRLSRRIEDYPPELRGIFEPCEAEEDVLDVHLRL